jgi:MOSC domain-containing protein YiiM
VSQTRPLSGQSTPATSRGTVINLQILPEHRQQPAAVSQVRALVDYGLEGDAHGKKKAGSRRQILILDKGTLRDLGLHPGDLREQITIDFPPLETLPAGTLLQIGQVTCELTGPCEPCTHIGNLVGVPDAVQFQMSLQGRRGQLAKVTVVHNEGTIRVGDPVVVIGTRDPTTV